MTAIVPADRIEQIVGVARHPNWHYARAVSAEQTVYILHSQRCLDHPRAKPRDLRTCAYSLALDKGIDLADWADAEDQPVRVVISIARGGRLAPRTGMTADDVKGG